MDRLMLKRGLVALGGLALVLAASGCRDRNLRVPPPAHYSDGDPAIPEAAAYPGPVPGMTEPATMDPYSGLSYGSADDYGPAGAYAPPGGPDYDPAATPAAGSYDPAYGGYGAGASAPAASDPAYGYDPTASDGSTPGALGDHDPAVFGDVHPSPSSPAPFGSDPYATGAVADPYAAMTGAAAPPATMEAYGASLPADLGAGLDPNVAEIPAAVPGLDAAVDAPPIPDDLPAMP